MYTRWLILLAAWLVACSEDSTPADDGTAGTSGAAGTSATAGSSGHAGTSSTAGSPNAGTSNAGTSSAGTSSNAGNSGSSTAGAGTGGSAGGGAGGLGGSAGSAGASGGASGSSTAGTSGGGTGGGGGIGGGGTGGTSGGTGGAGACTRETLAATLDEYLTALAAHDPDTAPLADTVKYTENTEVVEIGQGLWELAGEPKLVRTLFDTEQCATVSEVVLPEDGEDSVVALRLTSSNGSVIEAEAIITREGDWLFDAQGYVDSNSQKWDVLPEAQRTSREDLINAPRSYFEYFEANETEPAFGPNCQRLEGGQVTAACTAGIPDGVSIGNRRYWADVEAGVSVGFALFGGDNGGLLDAHFFRMIEGTIRNVHSMTVDSTFRTTGWPDGESADAN